MACSPNVLFNVDKPTYSTGAIIFKTLQKDVSNELFSFKEMSGIHEYREGFHKEKYENYFMGLMNKTFLQPKSQTICFSLHEIKFNKGNLKGTGETLYLNLDPDCANEWFYNPVVKSAKKKNENFLLIFQNVPFEIKSNKEIHFHYVSKSDAKLLIKHFSKTEAVGVSNKYIPLTCGATTTMPVNSSSHSSVFGIVRRVIKKPETTSRGTGHGIYALVDPSCYDERTLNRSGFVAQLFTTSVEELLEGNISAGDVLKLENFGTQQPKIKSLNLEFVVKTDCGSQFVLFHKGDVRQAPYCPYPHFNLTVDDIEMVEKLSSWHHELMLTQSIESPEFVKREAVTDPQMDTAGDLSMRNFERNMEELKSIYETLDPKLRHKINGMMSNVVAIAKESKKPRTDEVVHSTFQQYGK